MKIEGIVNPECNAANCYAGVKIIAQFKQSSVEYDMTTDSGLDDVQINEPGCSIWTRFNANF